jgi:hypothetical protein
MLYPFYNTKVETTKIIIIYKSGDVHPYISRDLLNGIYVSLKKYHINVAYNGNNTSVLSAQGVIFLNVNDEWESFVSKLVITAMKCNPLIRALVCCDIDIPGAIKWPDINSPTDFFINDNLAEYGVDGVVWNMNEPIRQIQPIISVLETFERYYTLYFPNYWNDIIQRSSRAYGVIYDNEYKGIYQLSDVRVPYNKKRIELLCLAIAFDVCIRTGFPMIMISRSDYILKTLDRLDDGDFFSTSNADLFKILKEEMSLFSNVKKAYYIGSRYKMYFEGRFIIYKSDDNLGSESIPNYIPARFTSRSIEYQTLKLMNIANYSCKLTKRYYKSYL